MDALPLSELMRDARWLPHRYEEAGDEVHFRLVPREAQRSMTFLTDAEIGEAPTAVYPRAECLAEVRKLELPAPRMIFHSAYCCSTLLARAFDIPGLSFGLKEPQILNDVAGIRSRGADPRQVAAVTDVALLLLARPMDAGEVNVIKPSNIFNPFIPLVNAMHPEVRGLLLHAPLDVYLGSVARKEIEGRAWVRELMWRLIQLGMVERFGFTTEELYRQTDLQVAAVGWLAQQALFAELARQSPNYRTLDSEALMAEPVECLRALATLFELDLDAEAVAAGPAFHTHSKDRSSYSPAERTRERDEGQAMHAREIGMVMDWSSQVADHSAVSLTLPSPLIS